MIMFEQSRRLSEPLRWGRREKTIVAVLVACVVLGLVGLGAYALSSGSAGRKDCVSLTFASTLGAAACTPAAAKAGASAHPRPVIAPTGRICAPPAPTPGFASPRK